MRSRGIIRIYENNVSQFLQVNALDGDRELARVGRLVARKTVTLRTPDAPDLGRWNKFYLDLEEYFKAEPGAIYRVDLSFTRKHSVYPCEGATLSGELSRTKVGNRTSRIRSDNDYSNMRTLLRGL